MDKYKIVKGNRGSNRAMYLQQFLERLNPQREAQGYKPYTPAHLGMKLAHIPTDELPAFYKQCERANIPFGAYFHWAIKVKIDHD